MRAKTPFALENHLPVTYVDYSFYGYVEEYGTLAATALLLGPPLLVFVLIYLMLGRKNKALFFILLVCYLLYNGIYMALGIVTLQKVYLSAAGVGISVFVYWLVQTLKHKVRR